MSAVHVDAVKQEISVQGEAVCTLLATLRLLYVVCNHCAYKRRPQLLCSLTGGAVYSDILAATEPYDLALPWGDAVQTGTSRCLLR